MKTYLHQDECGLCISLRYIDDGEVITFQEAYLVDAEYKVFGPNILPLLNKMWIIGSIHSNQVITQSFLFGVTQDIKNEERSRNQAP